GNGDIVQNVPDIARINKKSAFQIAQNGISIFSIKGKFEVCIVEIEHAPAAARAKVIRPPASIVIGSATKITTRKRNIGTIAKRYRYTAKCPKGKNILAVQIPVLYVFCFGL